MTTALIRSQDSAGTLKNVASITNNEGGTDFEYQVCGIADATTPTQRLAVDSSGRAAIQAPPSLPLPTGASTAAKQPALGTAGSASADVLSVQGIASMTPIQVADNGGSLTVDGTVSITANSAVNVAQVGGTNTVSGGTAGSLAIGGIQAHDAAISGNQPILAGLHAIAHGANPTAVAAADLTYWYANRHGIPWFIGGHPNIVTLEAAYTAAQTDTAIITVGAGAKIVVTAMEVTMDEANTVGVGYRIGFGTANTPTTTGVVMSHPGGIPGARYSMGDGSGILGIGADNEDLRITSEVPTSGSIRVGVKYYTVES